MTVFQFQSGKYDSAWAKLKTLCEQSDLESYEGRFTALLCGHIISLQRLQKIHNINFHTVSYHQIKDHTEQEMAKVRDFCEIDQSRQCHLPEKDTQRNSGLSRKNLQSYKDEVTNDQIEEIDKVLANAGYPICDKFPREAHHMAAVLGFTSDKKKVGNHLIPT